MLNIWGGSVELLNLRGSCIETPNIWKKFAYNDFGSYDSLSV